MKIRLVAVLAVFLCLVGLSLMPAGPVVGGSSTIPTMPPQPHKVYLPMIVNSGDTTNWWKGVGDPTGNPASIAGMPTVQWMYDWRYSGAGWNFPGYVPMVRPGANWTEVASLAAAHPGRVWLVGNEPDVADQDNMSPEDFLAQVWIPAYDTIKGADPTAKLYCCGTGFSNTAWLEAFRALGGLSRPVDGIHFHGYPCPRSVSQECIGAPNYYAYNARFDMDLATQKMDAFYAYLQTKAEFVGKPVWLTEFGILSTTDHDSRVSVRDRVMIPFIAYMKSSGLSKFCRVSWFPSRYPDFNAGDLTNADNSLTELGVTWNEAQLTSPW